MKALIIAEEESTLKAITPVVKSCGYETIVYHWLLKALDKVEEIAPDLVLISTAEYPRHWKTFVQFTKSGIGGVVPKVILYNERGMSNEEKEKARELGVYGMFSSLDKDGQTELKNYLSARANNPFSQEDAPKIEFIFTNPKNFALVTGTVRVFNEGKLEFSPDVPGFVKGLAPGDSIYKATFGSNKVYKSVGAKVLSNGKFLEIKLA